MLPQFVFDLAGSFRVLPLFHTFWRQWVLPCLFASTALAQHSPYRFDHWTTDDGLPQNTVNDICQTRDGYLWLTTLDGLVRYAAGRFSSYVGREAGFPPRFVAQSLYEDSAGRLWVGSYDGIGQLPEWLLHLVRRKQWPAWGGRENHLRRPPGRFVDRDL